ncbi:ATP-binding protein [Streptomyces sp. NPDC004539]|uniref:sensor histidine kinase n=1 Tax=Streptomyces sp. NPDC004539 TaxID=3154280 RepID=UPI0033B4D3F0
MPGIRDRRTRNRSAHRSPLRSSFVVPFLVPAICLTCLWGYTAAELADEQSHARTDADPAGALTLPTHDVLAHLQTERRLTARWQAEGTPEHRTELAAARARTDEAVTAFRRLQSGALAAVPSAALDAHAASFGSALGALSTRRDAPDGLAYLTDTASRGLALLTSSIPEADTPDALVTAALTSGRLTDDERALFGEYLAIREESATHLAQAPAVYTDFTPADTGTATEGTGLAAVVGVRADAMLLGAVTGAVAALAPVLAAWLVARRRRRASLADLHDLHTYAEELASRRLPQVLARVDKGERIDPAAALAVGTPRRRGSEEVTRLAAVIDRIGLVAAETAVRQHMGREGTEKVVAQLIRRTQILLHRLIALLDDLERKHEDSDLLHDIFKVDHLATRARRHAENLMILSGTPTGRRTNAAVPITDVMRASVAETEAYTRVKVKNSPADRRTALAARAVSDVTHLLAELIENGTSFSPPETQVSVSAIQVAKGLAIHVEDHGLGIPPAQRHQANQLLANPPRLDLTALGEDPRLGHFVVAKLSERHGVKVELRESVYGGTLSIVLIPADLLEEVGSPILDQLQAAAAATMDALPAADHAGLGAGTEALTAPMEQVLAGAGALTSGFDLPTHTRLTDYDGFPEYAGAGLLPPVAGHPGHAEPQAPYGYEPEPQPPAPYNAPAYGAPAYDGLPADPAAAYDSLAPETPAPYGAQEAAPVYGGGLTEPFGQAGHEAPYEPYPAQAPGPYGPGGTGLYSEQAVSPPYQEPRQPPQYGYDPAGTPAAEQYQQQTRPTTPPAAAPTTGNPPLTTPDVLPRRTRGAALAQQLRKEATQFGGEGEPDESVISPDVSARALSAIQRGLKRAQSPETDPPPPGQYDDEGP